MEKRFVLIGMLLAFASAAQADDTRGFFAGSGAGVYYIDFDDVDFDETALSGRVYGGYQLNEYVTFEGGYSKWFEASGDVLGTDVDIEGTSWDISVRPTMPIGDQFRAFGIIGMSLHDFETSAGGVSDSESDSDLMYGIGASYDMTSNWQVRGEWTMIDVDDASLGTVSASVTYNFK